MGIPLRNRFLYFLGAVG